MYAYICLENLLFKKKYGKNFDTRKASDYLKNPQLDWA